MCRHCKANKFSEVWAYMWYSQYPPPVTLEALRLMGLRRKHAPQTHDYDCRGIVARHQAAGVACCTCLPQKHHQEFSP
ncbi:hypothetical protein BC628DRAFT_969147 [Trametes gibbosa]|nr:hypothetical protein BC628DRAFT_969147 [Trametes gibbosa]